MRLFFGRMVFNILVAIFPMDQNMETLREYNLSSDNGINNFFFKLKLFKDGL